MRHDFNAIPDATDARDGVGSMLTRIYRDIGIAAVADALGLIAIDFDEDLARSIERGQYYLVPIVPATTGIERAA